MKNLRQAIHRLEEWPWGERYLTANRVLLMGCLAGPPSVLFLLIAGEAEEVGWDGLLVAFFGFPTSAFLISHWLMRWKRDGSPPFQP